MRPRRPGDHVWELSSIAGRLHDSDLKLRLRPASFQPGDVVTVAPFRVEVVDPRDG